VTEQTLFDAAPFLTAAGPPAVKLSTDQRRVRRQAEAIALGGHPLALVRPKVRVHPDAGGLTATRANAADRPLRCGTCAFRAHVGGYPKCLWRPGAVDAAASREGIGAPPRYSGGPATDTRAWWPACTEHKAVP
jgi:hypothetical protein